MALRGAVRSVVEQVLGMPASRRLSHNLARLGLHGLGVGLPPSPERSGETYFLQQLFRSESCALALDVGANVGDYTAALLGFGVGRVVAFEPVPASAEAVARRFASDPRVTLVREAVGESDERILLNVPSDSETSVLASRGSGASAFTTAPLNRIEVPMVTLDTAVRRLGGEPDFLKIDVEGFEPEVLAGARDLIASGSLKAVQIEFSYHHLLRGTTLLTFEAHLPGYRLFRIAARSLRPVETSHYLGTIYGFSNIVALRPDMADRLRHMI